MQLKSLKNSLASCSKELKNRVTKKGLLGKKKNPIPLSELRKLATAAGLGARPRRGAGWVRMIDASACVCFCALPWSALCASYGLRAVVIVVCFA